MNLREIEKLLEKYYEGETSLPEEEALRAFFATGEVPDKWMGLKAYFGFMEGERAVELNNKDFDKKVLSSLNYNRLAPLVDIRRPWIYWISGVAATILILVAVFVQFDPFSRTIYDTYTDPQAAYLEAKKVLFYVSEKFNKGTAKLEPVTTIDNGLKELKPVAGYTKVLNEVNRLDRVDKVEKLITNN